MTGPPGDAGPWVAVFDLDGTLTWHDTLLPYLGGYLRERPARWPRLWRLPIAALAYLLGGRDRGLLKSRVIGAVMGGETRQRVEVWSARFVAGLTAAGRFRPQALAALEAHRAAGDHLVLLSASPDLYVPEIGRLLGFERTLCTELDWDGAQGGQARLRATLRTPNRRGEEKSLCLARLRNDFPGRPLVAYGNSRSDLPHLVLADRALLVNGNASARQAALRADVATADWN